jgi:hypothetical protein
MGKLCAQLTAMRGWGGGELAPAELSFGLYEMMEKPCAEYYESRVVNAQVIAISCQAIIRPARRISITSDWIISSGFENAHKHFSYNFEDDRYFLMDLKTLLLQPRLVYLSNTSLLLFHACAIFQASFMTDYLWIYKLKAPLFQIAIRQCFIIIRKLLVQ